ncbi:class I SAM-dependent methyltransferase [Rhodoferax sp.]|uniref:class I SAM-dependent methyltransferase n=1 Tax=Rhodoferax sp. TaxID=50421 RepID=UPI00274FE22C|nr:class I SAM-dependent methyltransferase [Rhodoferax sp.]
MALSRQINGELHRLGNALRVHGLGIYRRGRTALTACASGIGDEAFRVRYIDLPDIIQGWVGDYLKLESSDVLDFGCGEGITALGMARRFNSRSVRGVDIMPDPLQCLPRARQALGLDALPQNLSLMQIEPGAQVAEPGSFDLIYSWSVFEHVQQPLIGSVLAQLKRLLRPGGYLFIQIAPLYYSSEGSHLFHRVAEPWGHLQNQDSVYFDKLCKACGNKEEVDALWSCYQWLNRLTVPELKRLLSEAGLKVVRDYTTEDPNASRLPAMLLDTFKRETLLVNQVVMLCRA